MRQGITTMDTTERTPKPVGPEKASPRRIVGAKEHNQEKRGGPLSKSRLRFVSESFFSRRVQKGCRKPQRCERRDPKERNRN